MNELINFVTVSLILVGIGVYGLVVKRNAIRMIFAIEIIANAANLINPDIIVISGGVVQAGDTLFQPLQIKFRELALPRVAESCKLIPAKLGPSAGMLGAARLAWQSKHLQPIL